MDTAGGDILFIEASITSGNGRLILTGQLGDVMKESAQAALTLAKGRAERFGLAADLLEKRDIHARAGRRDPQAMVPAQAWRCSSRSPRCLPTARCMPTWR